MTVWRAVQGWNTEGQPAELTILVGDPAPHPEGGYACDFLVSGLLRRSPAKRASGASPEEACDAARQAAVAEIVYYNSPGTDDAPLSEELDPAYVKMCRHYWAQEERAEACTLALPLAERG